jgi:hypothetical protein
VAATIDKLPTHLIHDGRTIARSAEVFGDLGKGCCLPNGQKILLIAATTICVGREDIADAKKDVADRKKDVLRAEEVLAEKEKKFLN